MLINRVAKSWRYDPLSFSGPFFWLQFVTVVKCFSFSISGVFHTWLPHQTIDWECLIYKGCSDARQTDTGNCLVINNRYCSLIALFSFTKQIRHSQVTDMHGWWQIRYWHSVWTKWWLQNSSGSLRYNQYCIVILLPISGRVDSNKKTLWCNTDL